MKTLLMMLKITFLLSVLSFQTYASHNKNITLISESYPPQFSYDLLNNGWLYEVVSSVFKEMQVNTDLELINWKRALFTAQHKKNYVLFAAYYNNDREKEFYYSSPIGIIDVGFFKLKTANIEYSGDLSSLEEFVISKGRGHIVTPEFDNHKKLTKFEAVDLLKSLKLLLSKRVDLAVGTKSTGFFWLKQAPSLLKLGGIENVEFIYPPLKQNRLYLAFSKRYGDNAKLVKAFNQSFQLFIQSEKLPVILGKHGFTHEEVSSYRNAMLTESKF